MGPWSVEAIEPGGDGLPERWSEWVVADRDGRSEIDPLPVGYAPVRADQYWVGAVYDGYVQTMGGLIAGGGPPPLDAFGPSWRMAKDDQVWVAIGEQAEAPSEYRVGG
jgi:hypothetical protein